MQFLHAILFFCFNKRILNQSFWIINQPKNSNQSYVCKCYSGTLGSAIKCFECNSHYNQGCELDNVPSNFSVDCSLKQDRDDRNKPIQYTICRKVMQIIEFSVNQCKLFVLLSIQSILPNQIHIRLSTLFRSSAS